MKVFVAISLFILVALVSCEPPASRNQYLPPGRTPSNRYLPPSGRSISRGSARFETARHASDHTLTPSVSYGAPDVTYAAPAVSQTLYGAPALHEPATLDNSGYVYGKKEENYGPAKYEFQYDVQDGTTGQDFGHKEARNGDKTTGSYYVLLPDGRKQIVKYEADQNGYRPVVTYENTAIGFSGDYDRNAQSHEKFNGY